MIKALKVIGVCATVASLLIHLSTFLPYLDVSMGQVFCMHYVAIILSGSIFFSARNFMKSDKGSYDPQSIIDTFGSALKAIPTPVLVMVAFFFFYAFINFFVFIGLMEGGSPSARDGIYYLHNHGQKIRDLTFTEYKRFLVYEVRGFSGHWIVFTLIPTIFYFYRDGILNAISGNKGPDNKSLQPTAFSGG